MRKILTLLAALACTAALNAATLNWSVSQMDLANNAALDGVTISLNDNLSLSFANAEATENNYIRYRKVTAMPEPGIAFYSKNEITLTATDATITSVKFLILTDAAAGNDATPGWSFKAGSTSLSAEGGDTWTGSESSLLLVGGSKATITGLVIEYTVNTPPAPDNTLAFKTAELFFSADQVGQGAIAQNVTLSDNGTSVDFTTTSTSAQIDASNGYFGTAEDYITIPYRYRPGGKSSNGINSDNKGVFSFPCPGTLTIYAYNNQSDDRNLQLVQNDVTILDHDFKSTDAVNPPNSTRNVYPIVDVEVSAGTAYLLWPVNQVMLFGFKFEPVVTSLTEGSIILSGGSVVDQTNQSAVVEDGTLVISTLNNSALAYILVPETATAVYYRLSNEKDNKNGRKAAPEGFLTATQYDGHWVVSLLANTNGTIEVQYEEKDGTLSPVSEFSYRVTTDGVPTGIEEVVECLPAEDGIIYNIFGQKVDESYKGIVIKNGRKYIQK